MTSLFHLLIMVHLAFAQAPADTADMEADLQKHPDHLSSRIQLANIYLKANLPDKVITLLNPYTDQLPSPGFLALGKAYSDKKDFSSEVRVLNLLVNKESEDFHWHILLAQAFLKQAGAQADPEKVRDANISAIQQFRLAVRQAPKYKPAFDELLNTLLQQKLNNDARELLMEGLTKFGTRGELLRELCRLDANDGYLDQAVDNCREAIKVSPNFPDNHVYLVQALYDQKEDQAAESAAVSAAKRFPKSEFVQWAAGTLFLKKKNYPVAARYFDKAVQADPKHGRSQYGLAQARFESGDEAGSYLPFMKACEYDASSVDTFLAAGGKLKQKGNTKLGRAIYFRRQHVPQVGLTTPHLCGHM